MKTKLSLYIVILFVTGFLPSCSNNQVNNKTIENLKKSLIRETNATAAYSAYKIQAEKEGLHQVAKLFKALSIAENIHATMDLDILARQGVKMSVIKPTIKSDSTKFNLEGSIKKEVLEIDSIYPAYIMEAKKSKLKDAENAFNAAWNAEKSHRYLLVTLYDYYITQQPKNGTIATQPSQKNLSEFDADYLSKVYYVCLSDGIIYDNINIPGNCDLCKTNKCNFIKIE